MHSMRHLHLPGSELDVSVEAGIPIVGHADAEGFEIPTVLPVVLKRELCPEFRFLG